ncbi:MAG: nucleotidyl transferase AbiEii/AbiGii toxin family protein [Candidatus Dadabacteria bacterium]|nr:nucleotidyl transferase AbiEii/AbiGii toxin family protein [Candidatus Dadabacteria bacterium]
MDNRNNRSEPQSAADYDNRSTEAVKSVLIEIGQILGSFRGKFAVVGGAVPWLLLDNDDMQHVGTIDIDLDLDPEALGDGEYANLVITLMEHGYYQARNRENFQLVRSVPATDGGPPIDVVVDFLMPRRAKIAKNRPPIIDKFAVIRADGAELALQSYEIIQIDGPMPEGGINRVRIAVASIPALLAMKGFAIDRRLKQKDAYDIYYCVRNFPGGPEALAKACRPMLEHEDSIIGYKYINEKFETVDSLGPTSVRNFVKDSPILEDRTPDQWQQDAFGQVDAWLRVLGLRK